MPSDQYLIDGQAVNTRVDWRATPAPGAPTADRREGFPGSDLNFRIVGQLVGSGVRVTGFLTASTMDALRDAILDYARMRADVVRHAIEVNGQTWTDLTLRGFGVVAEPTVFEASDAPGVKAYRAGVFFDWEFLAG